MKFFINIKKMTFDEEENLVEHEIILAVSDREFLGYDLIINLKDDDKFIQDTWKIIYEKDKEGNDVIKGKQFMVRADGWNSFPLYEIIDGGIVSFDYNKYKFFAGADRRIALAFKINDLYNQPAEAKILRKTFRYIMDTLNIEYPDFFRKYNDKVETIINKNPK